MSALKPHEQLVVDRLVGNGLSSELLSDLKENGAVSSYETTGNGFFLTLKHEGLPSERTVYSTPTLIGESAGIQSGFVIFIEDGELTIECHGWVAEEVPEDYRDQNIQIRET